MKFGVIEAFTSPARFFGQKPSDMCDSRFWLVSFFFVPNFFVSIRWFRYGSNFFDSFGSTKENKITKPCFQKIVVLYITAKTQIIKSEIKLSSNPNVV